MIIASILVIGIAGALTCLIQGLYQAYFAEEADPSSLASSITISMRFIVRSSLLLFLFLPFFVFAIVRRSILKQRNSPPK
ncbi:MAG: hypothetical protein CMO55_18680 [Verrucomicrobiales bacterium]|nr:hypothetical protein [Verrucomicrobiales bacterium]